MAESVELGHRQQGGGVRYLGRQARAPRQGQGVGQGGEGRPQEHRASGSGSKNRVLSGEPPRLLPDLFHCCLPAGAAEPAARRQGAHSGPPGVDGT